MPFIEGETIPRRILRDEDLAPARSVLAAQCGRVLAADPRHRPPSRSPGSRRRPRSSSCEAIVDRLGQPHPAFELGFRWLGRDTPAAFGPGGRPRRLQERQPHRGHRRASGPSSTGSSPISGDPLEDLGWLCVKAWRFGSDLPVGGFGTVEQLVDAYEEASGTTVDRTALHWWEVLGTLRWGVICIVQTVTHLTGAVRSVELAAIGRRVCEVEWDLLEMLP